MPLATLPEKKETFRKINYFKVIPGKRIVRVLSDTIVAYESAIHWVKNMYLICPGADCPICENNKKLYAEYGKTAKDNGLAPLISRWAVNVFDKTPVLTCPKESCGAVVFKLENNKFPEKCPECGTLLGGLTPHRNDQVYLWSFGRETLAALNAVDDGSFDETGSTQYHLKDIDIKVPGITQDGKVKAGTPDMVENSFSPLPDLKEDDLIDSSRAFQKLTAPEINEFLRGVKLGDIYKARTQETKEEKEEEPEDISSLVKDMYNES